MSDSGIPRTDRAARDYMVATAATIASDPALYLLQAADAAALTLSATNYSNAFNLADAPATRTELTVQTKDEMRNAAEGIFRLYLVQIKYNAGISSAAKSAIGIEAPNPSRSQRNVPATQVDVAVKGALLGSHTVTYTDSITGKKAKAFGAQGVELLVAVAEEPVTDSSLGKTYGVFSKNPIGVAFEHADNQKVATYWARWMNVRGQAGPWSNPVSMTIAA